MVIGATQDRNRVFGKVFCDKTIKNDPSKSSKIKDDKIKQVL